LRAGGLRHRISLQVQTETEDGMGGSSLDWAAVTGLSSVPAAIWPVSSKERIDSMKLELQITHKIRMRYISGITAKHRIVFGSRTFNITSIINPDERNIMLDMLCTEDI